MNPLRKQEHPDAQSFFTEVGESQFESGDAGAATLRAGGAGSNPASEASASEWTNGKSPAVNKEHPQPVMVDLFCGRGGWTKGFMAHGWRCIGIDLFPQPEYPGEFIQADIAQLYELPEADFYCCSSPCNEFTPHCLKMFRPNPKWPMTGIALFEHSRALLEATGKPYIMENVRCAQKFVGQAAGHSGSFYLWGHVPVILPQKVFKAKWTKRPGKPGNFAPELMLSKKERAARFAEIPAIISSHIAQAAGRML